MELRVVNQQPTSHVDKSNDGSLLVHSWFRTIQGEGPFAGTPALFVRLAGCNLQCPACDTEYTQEAQRMSVMEVLRELRDMRVAENLVVITGGEPFRQRIDNLCRVLHKLDYRVQIETNGVLWPGSVFPWERVTVVCSPKTAVINPKTASQVDAYKYVLEAGDVYQDGLPVSALRHPLGNHTHVARPPRGWSGPVFVQPMDGKDRTANAANLKACIKSAQAHGYTLGVQMHKLAGLP